MVIERLMVASAACVRNERAVGDLMQPCGKAGFVAKTAELAPRNKECFLRKIVSQCFVAAGKPAQQTADGRLVPKHQQIKCAGVTFHERATDKLGIIGFHGLLRLREVAVAFFPNDNVADSDG